MAKEKDVKLLVSFEGDWSGIAGQIVSRPADEAQRLIDAGFAIEPPKQKRPKREKAVSETRETATSEE